VTLDIGQNHPQERSWKRREMKACYWLELIASMALSFAYGRYMWEGILATCQPRRLKPGPFSPSFRRLIQDGGR
jgi:hypothetical protein